MAGLTPEAREALQGIRDLLEARLAAIANGTFELSSWTDEDGDVLALRLRPVQSLSEAPAPTERGGPRSQRWPYPW